MLGLVLALSGKNKLLPYICLCKSSGGMQLLLPFVDTRDSRHFLAMKASPGIEWWYTAVVAVSVYVRFPVTIIKRNAFDLEADGFRGDTLFRAKIIY